MPKARPGLEGGSAPAPLLPEAGGLSPPLLAAPSLPPLRLLSPLCLSWHLALSDLLAL